MFRVILCILVAFAASTVCAEKVSVTATPAIQSADGDLWVMNRGRIIQKIKRGQWTFCPGGGCPPRQEPPEEFETPDSPPEFEAPPSDTPEITVPADEVVVTTEQADYGLLAGAIGVAAFVAAGIRYRLSKRDPELVEDAIEKSEQDDVVEVN